MMLLVLGSQPGFVAWALLLIPDSSDKLLTKIRKHLLWLSRCPAVSQANAFQGRTLESHAGCLANLSLKVVILKMASPRWRWTDAVMGEMESVHVAGRNSPVPILALAPFRHVVPRSGFSYPAPLFPPLWNRPGRGPKGFVYMSAAHSHYRSWVDKYVSWGH